MQEFREAGEIEHNWNSDMNFGNRNKCISPALSAIVSRREQPRGAFPGVSAGEQAAGQSERERTDRR